MNEFNFIKNSEYSRGDVVYQVTGKRGNIPFNIGRTGYGKIGNCIHIFAFINIGFEGRAGKIFPNQYDEQSEILTWYGKKNTHSGQPQMQDIINNNVDLYCFARWIDGAKYKFLGIGKVLDFKDKVEVFDDKGDKAFCLQYTLYCKDGHFNPTLINNFDKTFEDGIPPSGTEGAIKYAKHKLRERNEKIVKDKKSDFLKKHGMLFCEVCLFDFKKTYGNRGDGFIECHHNIPLHEDTNSRETKLDDLSLLCSNCHRMIHRKKEWLKVDELKKIYEKLSKKNVIY